MLGQGRQFYNSEGELHVEIPNISFSPEESHSSNSRQLHPLCYHYHCFSSFSSLLPSSQIFSTKNSHCFYSKSQKLPCSLLFFVLDTSWTWVLNVFLSSLINIQLWHALCPAPVLWPVPLPSPEEIHESYLKCLPMLSRIVTGDRALQVILFWRCHLWIPNKESR